MHNGKIFTAKNAQETKNKEGLILKIKICQGVLRDLCALAVQKF